MNLIQASVQALLPSKRKTTQNGWTSFDAFCCHHRGESRDVRGRGGVRFDGDSFTYSCFNCGFKAGWSPGKLLSHNTKDLFKWMGMPSDEINRLSLEALKTKEAIPTDKPRFSFELHDVALPEDCKSIYRWVDDGCQDQDLINTIDYILGRGLTLDDYDWHWSSANGYKDRVILPFYYEGRVVGYTGRKIVDGKPKYLTHSQNGYVFNIDAQTYNRKYVIVVEGQFDAIAVDGVAIMHNIPNEIQCARINALGKEVIVVPDRDRPGAKLINAALEHGWSVSLPPWGDDVKDVSKAVEKYGKVYVLAAIMHYKESNTIKIELLKKKLEKINDN